VTEAGDDTSALTYDIKKITSNELQLFSREEEENSFIEITLHLKK